MSIQNLSKSAVRVGKNYIKGYTDTQIKVREATSNDPWGPSGTQMNELAQLSYNQTDFIEMMEILDKRLNDKGKNWRHVFKALTVLDYLLHAGSQSVWMYFHDNIYIVKTLKEFQYVDDSGRDQGVNVRQKAKEITNLLMDESRMEEQRRRRRDMDYRMRETDDFSDEEGRRRRRNEADRRNREDRELEQALEESRRLADEEDRRKNAQRQNDDDLQRALELSREEERRREEEERRKRENENLINLDGTDNDPYASLQPQYTSFNPYLQFQPTGFNPFFQAQMQQQEMLQQQYLQQQEYQRQLELQNAAQQYQQLMRQQQQPLVPQQTSFGSNNPWLSTSASSPPRAPAPAPEPEPAKNSDTLISFDEPEGPEPAEAVKPQQRPKRVITNDAHPELNRLLAEGEGVDTFGNTGDMRLGHNTRVLSKMMQQRTGTADGAALGSAAFGSPNGSAKPLQAQHTSSNPFY